MICYNLSEDIKIDKLIRDLTKLLASVKPDTVGSKMLVIKIHDIHENIPLLTYDCPT